MRSRHHPLHRILALPFPVAVLLIATASIGTTGCSRHEAPSSATPPTALTRPDAAQGRKDGNVLTATVTAGGIHATYNARFSGDQLKSISETRDASATQAPGGTQSGEYEFYGARLTRYTGAALNTPGTIELEFSLQGIMTRAHSSAGRISSPQVDAIRTRAQLLRSHALAQRAVRSHESGRH